MQSLKSTVYLLIFLSLLLSPVGVFADHADNPVHTIAQGSPTNDPVPAAADVTQEEMNDTSSGAVDVASLFWPIVPGTTVADGTFFLKQLKETFTGMMKFSDIEKATYNVELSEKRIVEANKLIEAKDYANALKSLEMSEGKRAEAINLKKKVLEAKQDALELINKMVSSFEKQKQVLTFFSLAMPADQKTVVDAQLKNIDLQISEAK